MGFTRIYYVCDVHGSQRCFRKFVNAVHLNIYKADIAILGGDLTGKALAPIIQQGDGTYRSSVGFNKRTARNSGELAETKKLNDDAGYYTLVLGEEEWSQLRKDVIGVQSVLKRLIIERMEEWVAFADERLNRVKAQCYFLPGNDDVPEIDSVIAKSNRVVNPDGMRIEIDAEHEMISLSHSNPTPWNTFRELPEDKLFERIEALTATLQDNTTSVFNFHCPPYNTGIDTAAKLDGDLRPVVSSGGLVQIPVGSTAIRNAIEKHQPLVTLHGHIHESPGEVRIGRTLCLNPGSEYNQGVLRGYVVDLDGGRVKQHLRVEG